MTDNTDKKKERVIHARVSENLDRELKDRAAGLGVSVSKLVRNALQNTFGLVEDIVADSAEIARSASGGSSRSPHGGAPNGPPQGHVYTQQQGAYTQTAPQPTAPVVPQIIGWQELVLNLNALCSQCNDILPKGTRAALAVKDPPGQGPRTVLCPSCLEEIRHDHSHTSNDVETPPDV